MKRGGLDFLRLSATGALSAVAAGFYLVALAKVAKPADAPARLAALNDEAAELAASSDRRGNPNVYPPKAICAQPVESLDTTLRQEIAAFSKSSGAELGPLDLAPGAAADGPLPLVPISLHLQASGRYDAVLGFISSLGRLQPEFFVDSMDIKSTTSNIEIKLSGRLFCSIQTQQ